VTFLLLLMVRVQVRDVPAQSPPHPAKLLPPPLASAVRVTVDPPVKVAEQVPAFCEQLLMPLGLLLTRVAELPAMMVTVTVVPEGVGVGVAVGAGVGVAVGAGVGVDVGATVGVAVGTAVGVEVGAGVGVDVGTGVGVDVGTAVGVAVGAVVGVAVGNGVGVEVGTGVGVAVGTAVGVAVGADVGVDVGAGVAEGAAGALGSAPVSPPRPGPFTQTRYSWQRTCPVSVLVAHTFAVTQPPASAAVYACVARQWPRKSTVLSPSKS
jgi:hypothetical protein